MPLISIISVAHFVLPNSDDLNATLQYSVQGAPFILQAKYHIAYTKTRCNSTFVRHTNRTTKASSAVAAMHITHSHVEHLWRCFAQCVAVPDLPSTRTGARRSLFQHIAGVHCDHYSASRPRRRKDSGGHQRWRTQMTAVPSVGMLDCLKYNIHLFNPTEVSL